MESKYERLYVSDGFKSRNKYNVGRREFDDIVDDMITDGKFSSKELFILKEMIVDGNTGTFVALKLGYKSHNSVYNRLGKILTTILERVNYVCATLDSPISDIIPNTKYISKDEAFCNTPIRDIIKKLETSGFENVEEEFIGYSILTKFDCSLNIGKMSHLAIYGYSPVYLYWHITSDAFIRNSGCTNYSHVYAQNINSALKVIGMPNIRDVVNGKFSMVKKKLSSWQFFKIIMQPTEFLTFDYFDLDDIEKIPFVEISIALSDDCIYELLKYNIDKETPVRKFLHILDDILYSISEDSIKELQYLLGRIGCRYPELMKGFM